MAKKPRQRRNGKKQPANQRPVERGRRSYLYLGLIGLALVAWIVWRLQPTQGLEVALFWGVVIGLAWGVFIVFYYLSQRKGGKEDE
jgi:FtsH-binding integral membrane protein